jgi:hypothetical protein
MRRRTAFWLRKAADFLDPRVKPTPAGELVFTLRLEDEQFRQAIERSAEALEKLRRYVPGPAGLVDVTTFEDRR